MGLASDRLRFAMRQFRLSYPLLIRLMAVNVAMTVLLAVITLIGKGRIGVEYWVGMPGSASVFISRPWTLLTYMVSQRGFIHLLFNMLWLCGFWSIGSMLYSQKALLKLYVAGGITGGVFFLAWCLFSPSSLPLLGASAAVMAMIAAPAVLAPDMRVRLMLFGEVRLIWIAVISVALTFMGTGGGNAGGGMAHLGGLAAGIAAGLMQRKGITIANPFRKISTALAERKAAREREITAAARRADGSLIAAMRGRLADRERLDELLDKIRISGYSSLSSRERNELNALSKRLDTTRVTPDSRD